LLDNCGDSLLDAPLEAHRVGTGGYIPQALAYHRLRQHGSCGGAVTSDVVGFLGHFLDELGADLLVRVLELDFLGDAHTIVGDGWSTPLLLQHDIAALGSKGHLHGVGEDIHPSLEATPRFSVELNQFGHVLRSPVRVI